jgi:hypothetical protein
MTMAETENGPMTPKHHPDEAALARFFAAARADAPEPPARLLNAILADAAEVAHARQPAPAPVPRPRWRRLGRLEPIGGWGGLAALGACAAFGFWVGIAGGITVEDGTVWAGSASALSDNATDPVGEFLALAAVEN